MVWHRYQIKNTWQEPPAFRSASNESPGDYDFHAFCLEIMDVIWAWALAGGVALVLALLIIF